MPTPTNRGTDETRPTHVPMSNTGQPAGSQGTPDPQGPTVAIPVKSGPAQTPPAVPPTPPISVYSSQPEPEKKQGARRLPWILLGILMVLLLGGAGTWMGFQSAVQLRKQKASEQEQAVLIQQFMAGLIAQENKQYDIARQQFEFVIQRDPTFPGAADKLREVMMAMIIVNTPTPIPTVSTPTVTPTPDLRPLEDIYNQARQHYANQEWEQLLGTIDSLRSMEPTYRAVELDGMTYVALRFRGIDKILMQANLEGGLYDLAMAEKYGPLDVDAKSYRAWARQYLSGSSFWDVDWLRVMAAFEDVYPSFPNMRDSSGMTALDRYRLAARNYADQLVEKEDACGAIEYYQKSLNAYLDTGLAPTATAVYLVCYPATATPEPTLVTPAPVTPTVETVVPPVVSPDPNVTVSPPPGP